MIIPGNSRDSRIFRHFGTRIPPSVILCLAGHSKLERALEPTLTCECLWRGAFIIDDKLLKKIQKSTRSERHASSRRFRESATML